MYPLTGTSKTTSNGAFTVTLYVTLIVPLYITLTIVLLYWVGYSHNLEIIGRFFGKMPGIVHAKNPQTLTLREAQRGPYRGICAWGGMVGYRRRRLRPCAAL